MEYKNTKTGVTFSSPCVISGGDWVLVEKEQVSNDNSKEEVPVQHEPNADPEIQKNEIEPDADQETKTGDAIYDSITIPQIKQELDAFGIKYSATAKKRELYDLMMAQGK
ncbi:hypothetical protein [Enterococcus faecium]|uniref:hypothetical protein n=1 Tax=Enterococcus faecium TaxID=1352 RepID=UPI000CF29DD9|nr:hypothetical protein [Enterococcus faecium]PQC91005.1 hypothetical protein CUN41_04685 [Enterococcus faecium]PQD56045.1 hypothetical protein CUM58_05355 [Enterococcus faecium]ROY02747.1 hypothetical protein EGY02_11930 [Enterococcus faecium]ROY10176.1 hypothetical protein EGW59_11930 [Enterococcus faecium]